MEPRSILDEIELPPESEDVAIDSIRMKGRRPLVVVCGRVEQVDVLEVTQTVPGIVPETAEERLARQRREKDPALSAPDRVKQARAALPYARPLIVLGCGVRRADGSVLKPAFSVGGSKPDTIPVERVGDLDALKLMEAVMRCSGYAMEGETHSFRDQGGDDGSGGANGAPAESAGGEAGAESGGGDGLPDHAAAEAQG